MTIMFREEVGGGVVYTCEVRSGITMSSNKL